MPSDRAAAPSGGAATDADRIAVIRALAAARQREEIVIGEQATRMDLAASAATIDELEELVADLTVRPALPTTVSPPQSGPDRPPAPTSRRGLLVGAAAAVAALAGGAVVWAGSTPDETEIAGPSIAVRPPAASAVPTRMPTAAPDEAPSTPTTPPDLLSPAGLGALIASYRAEFGTPLTYGLTARDDGSARADAVYGPVAKRRLQWQSWDAALGWHTIFDPHAAPPGERTVDLRRVDVDAVPGNVRRARRVLAVEEITGVRLVITHDPQYGPVCRYYADNDFGEVGLLVTDLAGDEVARFPFTRS